MECGVRGAQLSAGRALPRLVLAAGMQKAGTGWLFNILDALMVAGGGASAFAVRDRYGLGGVLTGANCNIGTVRPGRLLTLVPALRAGCRFAIKTHRGPNPWTRCLERAGVMRSMYLYRDPRDVVLSAFAHGQRERAAGRRDNFARLDTLERAIVWTAHLLPVWQAWQREPRTLVLRYEDLRADLPGHLDRLAAHLRVVPSPAVRADVLARFAVDRPDPAAHGALHFNRGGSGRWQTEMSPAQLALCGRHFGPYLPAMGYAP